MFNDTLLKTNFGYSGGAGNTFQTRSWLFILNEFIALMFLLWDGHLSMTHGKKNVSKTVWVLLNENEWFDFNFTMFDLTFPIEDIRLCHARFCFVFSAHCQMFGCFVSWCCVYELVIAVWCRYTGLFKSMYHLFRGSVRFSILEKQNDSTFAKIPIWQKHSQTFYIANIMKDHSILVHSLPAMHYDNSKELKQLKLRVNRYWMFVFEFRFISKQHGCEFYGKC